MADALPESWQRQRERLDQQLAEQEREEPKDLKSGGGGGTFDGMESRVNRLEQRADKTADDVSDIRTALATLTERVSHLPSKGYIDARLLAMLAAIAAIVLFADRIKAFIG